MSAPVQQRRQYFAWVWPKTAPGPLDEAAEQRTWMRVARRSAVTWLLLGVFTAVVASVGAPILLVLLTSPRDLRIVGAALVLGVPLALAAWLLLRAWGWGTYVSDAGLKVSGIWRTRTASWRDVRAVRAEQGRCTVLLTAGEMVIALRSTTPDWWARQEEFEIASLTLQRWADAARA